MNCGIRSVTCAMGILMLLLAPADARRDPGRIRICHIPPGNPLNPQILEVSPAAAESHFRLHGDYALPAPELCDGVDNDCDRSVDEEFPDLTAACSVGVGACRRDGFRVCAEDGLATRCDVEPGEPLEAVEESCGDGIDNDCDGDVDCGDPDCQFSPDRPHTWVCKVPVCGDGFRDEGEDCDDGNRENGDCCDGDCAFEILATPCGPADACVLHQCNGAGVCVDRTSELTGRPCPGNGVDACSGPDTCLEGVCQHDGENATPEVCCNGIDDDCDGKVDDATVDRRRGLIECSQISCESACAQFCESDYQASRAFCTLSSVQQTQRCLITYANCDDPPLVCQAARDECIEEARACGDEVAKNYAECLDACGE